MSTAQPAGEAPAPARNEVFLAGRVSSEPVERELPSGDRVVTFRLVLPRSRTPMTAKSRQSSDWVDCAAWGARARRSAAGWHVGDHVEIEGSLRRRFYRDGSASATRLEIEMVSGRCVGRTA